MRCHSLDIIIVVELNCCSVRTRAPDVAKSWRRLDLLETPLSQLSHKTFANLLAKLYNLLLLFYS